jgi:site-specific DNA-methyltransferase (adenine-specific)
MTVHAIGNATVYVGDCLESLRTMPEKSVHCCVTSPPYWGLRDYGTARWDGGDAECDHRTVATGGNEKQGPNKGNNNREGMPYRDTCGKCGAIRVDGQLGLEKTPEEYVAKMVEVFREVRRVLRDDGTLWLNLGDSYAATTKQTGQNDRDRPHNGEPRGTYDVGTAGDKTQIRTNLNGLKTKDLVGIPWRVAFALQADGWWLRQDIIWAKPNPMPESVTDRCTKSHEYVFLLSKSAKYFYDSEAVKEASAGREVFGNWVKGQPCPDRNDNARQNMDRQETRNRRSVWHISTRPYKGAHFATFPPALIEPCIKAGCPVGGVVLDPFGGSGTTGRVASDLGRSSILCELNADYVELIRQRLTEPAKPVKKKRQKAAC